MRKDMFSRASTLSIQSRIGLALIVAAMVGVYCYITSKKECENNTHKLWWSTIRTVALSAIAVFAVSGLFLGGGGATGGAAEGTDAAADPERLLSRALALVDTKPPSF